MARNVVETMRTRIIAMTGGVDSSTARRIYFRLSKDADGYPPASGETLWATAVGQGAYRIDNIPFFATGVSLGDVVEAQAIDGLPTFVKIRQRGGHATLRVASSMQLPSPRCALPSRNSVVRRSSAIFRA
jgi:Domain of unknown function (DUF4265)